MRVVGRWRLTGLILCRGIADIDRGSGLGVGTLADPVFVAIEEIKGQPCREKGADELDASDEGIAEMYGPTARYCGKEPLKDATNETREAACSSNDDGTGSWEAIELSGGPQDGIK
jgi:hypothetical protein